MENFVFENPTKVFFGNGCVREYLSGLAAPYQGSIMLAWGGGSIRRNGVYDEVCAALRATGRKIVEFSGVHDLGVPLGQELAVHAEAEASVEPHL